jgi:hypothetical protein
MVAATLRHLRSFRLMVCPVSRKTLNYTLLCFFFFSYKEYLDQRRDSGWIHTLLEEAENERMHLMFVAGLP